LIASNAILMSCCTQNAAELLRINREDRDYYGVISFFYVLLPHLAVERMIGYVSRQKDSYDMNHHEQSCISSIADDKEDVKNKA
jgi:hypothetical protein